MRQIILVSVVMFMFGGCTHDQAEMAELTLGIASALSNQNKQEESTPKLRSHSAPNYWKTRTDAEFARDQREASERFEKEKKAEDKFIAQNCPKGRISRYDLAHSNPYSLKGSCISAGFEIDQFINAHRGYGHSNFDNAKCIIISNKPIRHFSTGIFKVIGVEKTELVSGAVVSIPVIKDLHFKK